MTPTRKGGQRTGIVVWACAMGLPAGLLALRAAAIRGVWEGLLYAATWITLLHVALGAWILVRYLGPRSRLDHLLESAAAGGLAAGVLAVGQPAAWCACFAAALFLVVLVYRRIHAAARVPWMRSYTREKILVETPLACALALAAVVLRWAPATLTPAVIVLITAGTSGFALWLIGVRRLYARGFRDSTPPDSTVDPGRS